MSTFRGFISKINTKSGRTAKGRAWTLYSIKLENEDGTENDKWLSAGFEAPSAREGDYVSIEAEANDKGFLDVKSINVVKNPPAKAAKQGAAPTGKSSTTQTSIHYQSARKDAIEVLGLLIAKDGLPLSSAKTASGVQARYEEIMALVDKLTVRYFQDAETHRILKTVIDESATTEEGNAEEAEEIDE